MAGKCQAEFSVEEKVQCDINSLIGGHMKTASGLEYLESYIQERQSW
jgi:hypothetical protein